MSRRFFNIRLAGLRTDAAVNRHDRARGHRGLPTAIGALIGEGFGLKPPSATSAATRADKPVGPTAREKVFRARAVRRKAALNSSNDLGNRPSDADTTLTLLIR
jgi:hypothetical protein